jgi:sugar fermentation stimulation protein A
VSNGIVSQLPGNSSLLYPWEQTAVVFIVQRADAHALTPHETADPLFAQTLRTAVASGVEARAYSCRITLKSITIAREIPVQLSDIGFLM